MRPAGMCGLPGAALLYWPPMNAEFNVWLLVVGLIVGAGLVWLVVMDSRRRETEIDATERPREAAWLSQVMAEDGFDVSPEAAEQLLLLHRAYLGAPPPDEVVEDPPIDEPETSSAAAGGLAPGQRPPASTGAVSSAVPAVLTNETPNRAPPDKPETAGTGPIQ
jgi:hypothetical protein